MGWGRVGGRGGVREVRLERGAGGERGFQGKEIQGVDNEGGDLEEGEQGAAQEERGWGA